MFVRYLIFYFSAEIKGFGWMSASNNQNVATFVNTWLPVVTLMILMTLLPYVFQYLATKYENRKTYSNIENSILRRYFLYQVRESILCDLCTKLFF